MVVGANCPPFHPNCRTTIVPYIEGLVRNRVARNIKTGKSEEVGDLTYKEWYAKYVENSDELLKNKKKFDNIEQIKDEVKNVQYIGEIDISKIGKYSQKIVTKDIVLTEERKLHIYENHKKDYDIIMKNLSRVVLKPSIVLEDLKNKDTLFFIDKLDKNNLNVVVKLNTTNNEEHPQNSVMTAWVIRDKNLKKLKEKNNTIYKNE